jgi:8-oxo-dGTP pyrophosphatase MutT (NUDIX family)
METHPPVMTGVSKDGRVMHFSSGAIIERDGMVFLEDRAIPPFGFAAPAGHIDAREDEVHALVREVKEETGLDVTRFQKVAEEDVGWETCSMGVDVHHWHVFRCEVEGVAKVNDESKSGGWFSKDEIAQMRDNGKLEPIWKYWFEKLGII